MTSNPLMPLEAAVTACFPHGGGTKATLLAACRKGALAYAKVGNHYFVTEADISGWIDKCRAKPSPQAILALLSRITRVEAELAANTKPAQDSK
jgi:hypothetical protein